MAKDFDDSDGVWRTIAGRKVFIREGQSLSSAMKQSGKFKSKKQKLSNNDEDKEIKGRIEELQREIDSGRNSKEKTERLKEELQQYKDSYELDEKYSNTKEKNLNDLKKERDAKFKEIVDANTERQDIYEHAMSDEAYKDLYGKEREKNAKTELNEKDYKRFEELTNKYHEGRKELRKIDEKIAEYRSKHPKESEEADRKAKAIRDEQIKKEGGTGWERLEKERQLIKEEASKAGKSVEQYEKERTKDFLDNVKLKEQGKISEEEFAKDTLTKSEYVRANKDAESVKRALENRNIKLESTETKKAIENRLLKEMKGSHLSADELIKEKEDEINGWKRYRDSAQKTINRSSNPDSQKINVRDRDIAIKEIERAKSDIEALRKISNNNKIDELTKKEKLYYNNIANNYVEKRDTEKIPKNIQKLVDKGIRTKLQYDKEIKEALDKKEIRRSKKLNYNEYLWRNRDRITRKQMGKMMEHAYKPYYKNAFQEYKKEHPNSKLTFKRFVEMIDED